MRVLIVDQDSTMLEAIAHALADYFSIDTVTSKADCLDLLLQNPFDVVISCERLADGSGLELLSQIGKRWPDTVRMFAAERARLKLLRGRLGPFDLFKTLTYPLNATQLLSALTAATSAVQGVEAGAEDSQSEPEETAPAPAPATASPLSGPAARSVASAGSAGSGKSWRARARGRNSAAAQPDGAAPRTPARKIHSAQASATLASNTGPVRSPTAAARMTMPAMRIAGPGNRSGRAAVGSMSQVSATAAAALAASRARSAPRSAPGSKRGAFFVGAGAIAVLAVGVLAVTFLNIQEPAPTPSSNTPVARQPHFSREIVQLVADTEAAFGKDDFRQARENVLALREIAPNHPRLPFFEALLSKRGNAFASESPGSGREAGGGAEPRSGVEPSESMAAANGSFPAGAVASAPPAPVLKPTAPPAARQKPDAAVRHKPAPAKQPAVAVEASKHRVADPVEHKQTVAAPASVASTSAASSSATSSSAALSSKSGVSTSRMQSAVSETYAQFATTTSSVGRPAASPASASSLTRSATAVATPVVSRNDSNRFSGRTLEDSSAGTAAPRLLRRVPPDYPTDAARRGVEGFVEVSFVVTADGSVEDVAVVRSDPPELFDRAAIAAVRRWKYEPKRVNGGAVDSREHVRVQFKLDR